MSQFTAPIEVFNAALVRAGENTIAENDTSLEANLFRGSYESFVRGQLRRHKWSFATKAEKLPFQGESGNSPLYVYQPSAEVILAHKCTIEQIRWTDYELRGGKLLTSIKSEDLVLHYTFRAHESEWADDFAEGVVCYLEGLIVNAIGDQNSGRQKMIDASNMLLDALGRDRNSQQAPDRRGDEPLIDAWRGIGRRYSRRAT